jgi:hypothetical protein
MPSKPQVLPDDRLARLLGVPVLSLSMSLLLKFGDPEFGKVLIMTFLNCVVIWEGCRQLFIFLRRRFPRYNQTSRRLLYQAAAILAYTGVVALFMNSVCHTFWPDDPTPTTVFQDFIKAIIPTVCITLVYESVYFFEEWKNNVKKTESLARENVQSQLDALRNQLDPHFLFNSLNTLASLIDFENDQAQQYLERLSDVYRYVLVSRDKNTVTLEEEIAFLDAYVYLNKVRFRENLQVVKEIWPGAYQQQVAPLSLQMLVENAIKHNVVSKERPLQIRIVQEEATYLSVVNNVQEKTIFEKSTKVGLQNITNRYRLLSDRQVQVSRDHGVFKVRIPLLQPALS